MYNLSGAGQVSMQAEYIGKDPGATAVVRQSGGTNTASYVAIGQNDQYTLSGGSLQINSGLENDGLLNFAGGPAVVNANNAIINLARLGGSILNTQAATLNVGGNSLLIVPPGFNPSTAFAHYSNTAILHTAGTPLVLASNQTVTGQGNIDDPVTCNGTIVPASAPGASINLNNGLMISPPATSTWAAPECSRWTMSTPA